MTQGVLESVQRLLDSPITRVRVNALIAAAAVATPEAADVLASVAMADGSPAVRNRAELEVLRLPEAARTRVLAHAGAALESSDRVVRERSHLLLARAAASGVPIDVDAMPLRARLRNAWRTPEGSRPVRRNPRAIGAMAIGLLAAAAISVIQNYWLVTPRFDFSASSLELQAVLVSLLPFVALMTVLRARPAAHNLFRFAGVAMELLRVTAIPLVLVLLVASVADHESLWVLLAGVWLVANPLLARAGTLLVDDAGAGVWQRRIAGVVAGTSLAILGTGISAGIILAVSQSAVIPGDMAAIWPAWFLALPLAALFAEVDVSAFPDGTSDRRPEADVHPGSDSPESALVDPIRSMPRRRGPLLLAAGLGVLMITSVAVAYTIARGVWRGTEHIYGWPGPTVIERYPSAIRFTVEQHDSAIFWVYGNDAEVMSFVLDSAGRIMYRPGDMIRADHAPGEYTWLVSSFPLPTEGLLAWIVWGLRRRTAMPRPYLPGYAGPIPGHAGGPAEGPDEEVPEVYASAVDRLVAHHAPATAEDSAALSDALQELHNRSPSQPGDAALIEWAQRLAPRDRWYPWTTLCARAVQRDRMPGNTAALCNAGVRHEGAEVQGYRGIYYGRVGRFDEAAQDFRAFIAAAQPRHAAAAARRLGWLNELEQGRDPFVADVLQELGAFDFYPMNGPDW